MENAVRESTGYGFFLEEAVERHFADLNIKLLSGRHIQQNDANVFFVLEDYFNPLRNFYSCIYKLALVRAIGDRSIYFYLNFFDEGKGKLSDPSRSKTLTELQTIVGLALLDMYYSRYFDHPKIISWPDIQKEIMDGEHKLEYQRIFFENVGPVYSENAWAKAEKRFTNTIKSFDELGWVRRLSNQQEQLRFELQPSIHRIADLYAKELQDFVTFCEKHKNRIAE